MEESEKIEYFKKCKEYFSKCKEYIDKLEKEVEKGTIILDDLKVLEHQEPIISVYLDDPEFYRMFSKIQIKYRGRY